MDPRTTLAALEQATTAMAATVRGLDPRQAVPTCPGWDVTSLVDHLGRVHLWAEAAVRTGVAPDPYPRRDTDQDLVDWYAASAGRLVSTLGERSPLDRAWSFSAEPEHSTVGFWCRRQLHETTVHGVDALAAAGAVELSGVVTSVPGVTVDQAVDGVAEVLEVFVPRVLVRRADEEPEAVVPAPGPVALRCTDAPAAWTLQQLDGRPLLRAGAGADAVATVSGPATHLYLALWHRADPAVLAVEGDAATARRLLEASLVP